MPGALKPLARILSFLIFFVILLFTACGTTMGTSGSVTNIPLPAGSGTPKADYDQQVLRFPSYTSDIHTLDPAVIRDVASIQAARMVFSGLVRLDSNSQLQPDLAASWQQSPDGLRWTFHLRPHLTFSDGTTLTSYDVAYSLDRSSQPPFGNTDIPLKDADTHAAGKLKTLIGDSILTPDATTVTLVAAQKTASFLQTLTASSGLIVEKHLIDKYGSVVFTKHLAEGGASGPFTVSQYIHKQEIDFAPNPYYYGLKPFLQKVVFHFFASSEASYEAYLRGELEYTSVPIATIDDARQRVNEFVQRPALSTAGISMNFLAKPFDNLHIRQAFDLAVNRETINTYVFHGAVIPSYHIILQGVPGYNLNLTGPDNVKDTRGNVPLARQLFQQGLQEEGWSSLSQLPPIRLTYAKGLNGDKLFNQLSQAWRDAFGVTVEPEPLDFNQLVNEEHKVQNNPNGLHIWLSTYGFALPDPFTQMDAYENGNYLNYGQNASADAPGEQAVEQQIQHADTESNPVTRLQLYQSAEQQLINQVAFIALYQNTSIVLIKPYIQGASVPLTFVSPVGDWTNLYVAQQ